MRYIADTNVLLHNPEILETHDMVITSHVLREIEELELKRKSDRQLQWEIRRLKRYLDDHDHYSIDLKDYEFKLDEDFSSQYVDNILLQVAVDNGYGMATNDRLLKEKCKVYNIPLLTFKEDHFIEHKGFKEVYMIQDELDDLNQNLHENKFDLLVNEYLIIYKDDILDGEDDVLLDIFKWNGEMLESLPRNKKGQTHVTFESRMFDRFTPKDAYQMIAVDSILSNQITQLRGRAGSGKSKIALETAWHLIEREHKKDGYERLVIFVNPTPSRNAQELGFYKGDKLEKLLQSSVGTMLKSKFGDDIEIQRQMLDNKLDILPFVDIRGYETGEKKTILWILEAQNLTSDLMKLGLQRVSENTKVIIDGDFHQQVDKDAYATDNGMKRVSEVFRGEDLYGEVELQNIYRSKLADIADKM